MTIYYLSQLTNLVYIQFLFPTKNVQKGNVWSFQLFRFQTKKITELMLKAQLCGRIQVFDPQNHREEHLNSHVNKIEKGKNKFNKRIGRYTVNTASSKKTNKNHMGH